MRDDHRCRGIQIIEGYPRINESLPSLEGDKVSPPEFSRFIQRDNGTGCIDDLQDSFCREGILATGILKSIDDLKLAKSLPIRHFSGSKIAQ